jgi:hypothetical protein
MGEHHGQEFAGEDRKAQIVAMDNPKEEWEFKAIEIFDFVI